MASAAGTGVGVEVGAGVGVDVDVDVGTGVAVGGGSDPEHADRSNTLRTIRKQFKAATLMIWIIENSI